MVDVGKSASYVYRCALALSLIAIPLLVAPHAAASASNLYSQWEDGAWDNLAAGTLEAQSFTTCSTSSSMSLAEIRVRNQNASGGGNVNARLFTSSGGQPGAPLHNFGTYPLARYIEGIQLSLTGVPTLQPSTDYFIVVSSTFSNGDGGWKHRASPAPTTSLATPPTFSAYISTNSGTSWTAQSGRYYAMKVSATPNAVPSAPTLNSVAAGNGQVNVNATLNTTCASDVTRVEYSLNGGAWTNSGGATGIFTISGLNNGTQYSIAVRSVNGTGNSLASNSIDATPKTVPDAPTSVNASAGDGNAAVTWLAPPNNGGSVVTGYTVTASPGGATCSTAGTICTVNGLTNGSSYTFTVVATNGVGSSVASSPSAAVTPQASGGSGGGGTPPVPEPSPSPTPTPTQSPSADVQPEQSAEAEEQAIQVPTQPPTKTPRPTKPPTGDRDDSITTSNADMNEDLTQEESTAEEVVDVVEEDEVQEEVVQEEANTPSVNPTASSEVASPVVATTNAQPGPGESLFNDEQLVGPVLDLRVDLSIGSTVAGRSAVLQAAGLQPNSEVFIQVFSTPQTIGAGVADSNGNAAIQTELPAGLPPGVHTIVATGIGPDGSPVQSIGALEIDGSDVVTALAPPGQVSSPMDPTDPQLARALSAGKPLYDVAIYPAVTATVAVAGAALLGFAGAGGLTNNSSGEQRGSRGKLSGVVTKKLKALKAADPGVGDRSRTWAMPFTRRTDSWIKSLPIASGRFSALVPRLLVDGAWSRAMFGSGGFLLWGVGLVLGLISAWSTGFEALPPALPLILAIMALGILDAAAGAIAWLTITISAAVTGHITTWPEVRTVLGLFVLFASISLLAHAIRPLRRMLNGSRKDFFDRFADYVMPPIFLAFAATSMFKALNGLSGIELVSPEDFGEVRIVVITAFLARMALEDIATHAYPVRSSEVQPAKLTSPGRQLALLSVAIRVGLFLIIAEPFFGLGWATYLSALLVAIPMTLKVFEDDLPNLVWLNKWFPRGVGRFALTLVIGIYVSFWLLGQDASDEQVRQTYNFILLPGIVVGLIELIGREGWSWPDRWLNRLVGLVIWVFAVGIVTGLIALV